MLKITDKTETYNYIQSCTCIFLRKLIFQYRALKCKNVKAIRAAYVLPVVYKWVIKKRFSNYTCMANQSRPQVTKFIVKDSSILTET